MAEQHKCTAIPCPGCLAAFLTAFPVENGYSPAEQAEWLIAKGGGSKVLRSRS